MKILMIAINDPAGAAIALARAINRCTRHQCRLITRESRYNHKFEKDLHLPWLQNGQWDEIEQLLRESDIFHFHMTTDENSPIGPFLPRDYMGGKLVVHHHHGHPDFRANSHKYRRKYRDTARTKLLVSTPDLLHLLPGARWQPNVVPVNHTLYLPGPKNGNGHLNICQAPTRKDLKNTDTFVKVMKSLQSHYGHINYLIIEDVPHKTCLSLKQGCDIHFDHMQGYYGMSSLESLSQGKPVIAGLDPWNVRHIEGFVETDHLPWIVAQNETELQKQCTALIDDHDFRHQIGRYSRYFMEQFWNEERGIERLMRFYEN